MNSFRIPGTDFTGQLEKTLVVVPSRVIGFDAQKEPVLVDVTPGIGRFGGVYQGRAPAPPDDTTAGALDYPLGGGSMQQWDVPTQAWV